MAKKKATTKFVVKDCVTCVFARWELTKTGKISSVDAGRCNYKIVMPVLPSSVPMFMRDRTITTGGIRPGDGEDCPCYQEGKNNATR